MGGSIDWTRRFDHMQQHSGEHILSGLLCSLYDCSNVGFHLGADTVTIDYDRELTWEQVLEAERQACLLYTSLQRGFSCPCGAIHLLRRARWKRKNVERKLARTCKFA